MVKRRAIRKNLLRILLSLTFMVILYVINLFWMRPWSIDHYLAKELILDAMDSPEALTYLGLVDGMNWLTNHQSKLSIYTPEELDQDLIELKRHRLMLNSFDDDFLTQQQLNTKKIAIFESANAAELLGRFPYHDYPLNQISGDHLNLIEFLNDVHPIRDESEAAAYLDRLDMLDDSFAGTLEILKAQSDRGIFPPRFVFAHLENQINEFLVQPLAENPLYTVYLEKLGELDLTENQIQDYGSKAQALIDGSVKSAYQDLLEYVLNNQQYANPHDGVWSLPEGEDYYALMLRMRTTTDYSAEEIHQMGLEEVERIEARMSGLLSDLGHLTEGGVGEAMNDLNELDRFLYQDTSERKSLVVKDYQNLVSRSWDQVEEHFEKMPEAEVEVRAVPAYSEENQAGGYYQSPSLDGSRPGVFYANLYDIKQTPKYSMATLVFHEAVPGHHLQIALNLENSNLSIYRRFGYGSSAFSEGWALYAESLAVELGMARDAYDELGVLQSELFRAVRLVVDTGMHQKRWTRKEAIDYMKGTTGMSDSEVVAEIERYIVWPGQACSYKVGALKILEQRERAKRELGERFDLREFHSRVLGHGEPPLFIVEELIDQYLQQKSVSL